MSSGYQEPTGGTASVSTGTAVGSKPIRALLKVLRNVDIVAEPGYGTSFIPKVKTPFQILSTSLQLHNPAQTFFTNFESAVLLADQSIKIPIITATESSVKKDEVVLLKQSQALENKSIPTFLEYTETTAPDNPAAGKLRIYANSTTHELTQRDSTGAEKKFSDGSGGGGGAPSDAQYLTLGVNATLTNERVLTGSTRITITDAGPGVTATLDVGSGSIVDSYIGSHTSTKITITAKGQLNSSIVYTDQANSFGDFAQTFKDNQLKINNPADTFAYTIVGAAIGANRNVTLPLLTGNDTAVTEAFSQALTNKTIDFSSNTGSNIGDSAIAAHTSTKITITTKGQLNSSIAYVDQANVFSDNDQSFRSTRLRVANPANTFFYNFTASAIAANRAITIPLLTAGDEMLFKDFAATVTNKSMSGSSNTFTNIGDSAISSHTSTKITITAKGQLNSSILYSDVDNALGSHYYDITEMAAPANPSAGVLRIYANSTTHELTQRDSSGTERKFSDGSGGAGAPTNVPYLTLASDATLSAERVATASSRVTITDAGANSTATFDIGSGSIVDAYIGSHTSTKISITAKGQLNSQIAYKDETLWLTNAMVSASAAISQTKISPVVPGDYLYKIYIDTNDSNKYKAFNYDTNVVTDSGSSTDVLSLFNSIIDAASTAKRPVKTGKGFFKFSANPTIAGKWINNDGTKTGGHSGGKGDPTNETVYKKCFTDNTNPFFNHDGSTTWTKQQWKNITFEGKDANNDGTGAYDDGGIGFQAKSTGTGIAEIYDYMHDVMICHFGTALKLMKCWQLSFHDLTIYRCGSKGIHLTDDGTSNQCVEIRFNGGEVRLCPTNVHVEKATQTKLEAMILEGDSASPYTQVNSVKIDANAFDTRIWHNSFENNVNGITQILDAGRGTTVDANRFGGLTWTAQTVYNTAAGSAYNSFINNTISPYTNNAVATVLLSSTCKNITVDNNHVMDLASNCSLVINDSSGNPTTNTIGPKNTSSSNGALTAQIGPPQTYHSPMTLKSTAYLDIEERSAPSAPAANFLRAYMDSSDESLRVKNSSNTVFNLFSPTGLVDANIGSHTSTKITITAKGQLNSSILYGDQNNSFGAFYHDITEIAAPSNPSAGTLRIWADSTSHELSQKDSSGTVKKFSDGSGGGITASSSDTLTNKKISGLLLNYNAKTANYTATRDDDYIPVDATSANVTISLPTAVGVSGKVYTVRKTDSSANTVIIDPNSTETIGGSSTLTLTRQHQQVEFYSDGSNWLNENRIYVNPTIDMDAATTWRYGSSLGASIVFQANNILNLSGTGGLFGVIIDPDGTAGDGFQIWDSDYSHKYQIAADDIAAAYKLRLPKITSDDFFVSRKTAVEMAGNPVYKRWGSYQPMAPTTVSGANIGNLEGILMAHVPTGAGTNTNTWDTTEGLLANLVTTTTANQNAGLVSPQGSIGMFRREQRAKIVYRGKIDTVAGGVARLYVGVSSANAIPTSDTPVANADSAVIVGFKSTATNYEIYTNDGSGAASTTTVTGTIAKNTSFHTIELEWEPSGNIIVTFDGTAQTISTDFPATSTNLFFHCTAQNATAAIRTHSIVGVWVEGF